MAGKKGGAKKATSPDRSKIGAKPLVSKKLAAAPKLPKLAKGKVHPAVRARLAKRRAAVLARHPRLAKLKTH